MFQVVQTVFFRSESQSSVGEITLQGKITSLDLSPGTVESVIRALLPECNLSAGDC